MKNKYFILYIILVCLLVIFFKFIDHYSNTNMQYQKQILIKQAQTHFNNQVNTRKWNARFGGIYVKPKNGLKPNKYLKNNTLKVDENLTLIKINPAWMTRQLSEQSDMNSFHFRITSLKPINPGNVALPFEKKALTYFEKTGKKEYYEIDKTKKFQYMGALMVDKSCMKCHKHQGYDIGDIRGGISVTLDTKDYFTILTSTQNRAMVVKTLTAFLLLSITLLIHKLFKNNEGLNKNIKDRTKELEYEKNHIRKILDENPNIIIVTNGKQIISSNKRFFEFFGYKSIKEFLKVHKCVCDFFTEIDDKALSVDKKIDGQIWYDYLLEDQEKNHIVTLLKDDEYYQFIINAILLNKKGDILLTMQDITELKQKDKLLYKSEKMASMGEMIGNIAHQWRQPLSVISTGATGMKMQKEYGLLKDEELYRTCDSINKNAQYLSKTIDDFRSFIKNDRDKKIFSLKEDIDSFLNLVEGTIKSNDITIVLDLHEDIKIDGYANELTQCFINIFNNAKDALVDIDDKFVFISTMKNDKSVLIKIKDNAGGISSDIMPKIFEPYFTTKHQSQGTGLGLHMTYNLIVDGMNGNIEAINTSYIYNEKEYEGVEFVITLPID